MKTRYIIAAASALLLLAGCAREMDFQKPGSTVLRAVIESGETRVSFDEMGKFSWDEGDQIAVYVGSAFETVTVNHESGEFKVEGDGDRSFYAVYPASAAPTSATALTVTLPASYDISGITDADFSPVPMVAQNLQAQDELYFLHVGGLVRIFGKVDAPASTAVVTFDKDVTGTYTVDTSDGKNPTITTNGNSTNNEVTFTLPNATTFVLNVPVPCGTYETIKISIDGGTPVQLNTTALTFARHHGKTLDIGSVSFEYELEGLHEVISEYLGGAKELAQSFSSYKSPDGGATKVGVPFVIEFSQDGETGWSTTNRPTWLSVAEGVDYSGSTTGEPLRLVIAPQVNTAVDEHANILAARTEKDDFDLSTVNVATGQTGIGQTTANCYVVDAPGTYKFPVVYGNGLKDGVENESAWHAQKGVGGEYRDADYLPAGVLNDIVEPYKSTAGLLGYFKDHRDNDITSSYILTHLENLGYTNITLTPEIMWMDVLSNNGSGPKNGRLLVQDVAMSPDNKFITFSVPAESIQQGSAAIALKATYTVVDGETTQTFTDVVWSWHIWVTDHAMTAVAGPDGYYFAPVNLGWRDTRELSRYDERSWYVRVRQTEEDPGVKVQVEKVTARAGNITIESGGRSMVYQFGRKDPRPGSFLKTVGTADPKPTGNGNFYAGYNLPVAYPTGAGSVPEIKAKWKYSDYGFTGEPYDSYGEQDGYYEWDDPVTPSPTKESLNLVEPYSLGLGIRYPRVGFAGSRIHTWVGRSWSNMWDSSLNTTGSGSVNKTDPTKTIYDPCPVGYQVPTVNYFTGFNTGNTTYTEIEGVPGRKFNDNEELFLPFIPNTGSKTEMGRYSFAIMSSTNSRALFDIYPEYVYGRTSESMSGSYVIRPVKE